MILYTPNKEGWTCIIWLFLCKIFTVLEAYKIADLSSHSSHNFLRLLKPQHKWKISNSVFTRQISSINVSKEKKKRNKININIWYFFLFKLKLMTYDCRVVFIFILIHIIRHFKRPKTKTRCDSKCLQMTVSHWRLLIIQAWHYPV